MNKQNQLAELHHSGKPYIIYKSQKGFNLYTNFSKKIILNNKNVKSFLSKKYKGKSKNTDLFIGFLGYELLNNLIKIKIPRQKNINFPKGIFYKPEKIIELSNKLNYQKKKFLKKVILRLISIRTLMQKFFLAFKKELNAVRHIKLRFVLSIKQDQK